MKNGIETRPNGNRIIKRQGIGYDVHILRADGGFRRSDNGPLDYLRNARHDANTQTPLHIHVESAKSDVPLKEDLADLIREHRKTENIINNELKFTYLPLLEKCNTREEVSTLVSDIKRTLGFECGDEFPGTFEVEVVMQYHRIIIRGGKDE